MRACLLSLLLPLACAASWRRGKLSGKPSGTNGVGGFDEANCKWCMAQVMRQLTPTARGCAEVNGTVIPSSSSARAPTAFCESLLPKKRSPVVYSFGVDNIWDFDQTMAIRGSYNGVALSDDPHRPNASYPVLTLKTIMDGYGHSKVDVLRMRVFTNMEWKSLKNLINSGAIQTVRQLSLNLYMGVPTMWHEYRLILSGLKKAGFFPFYVSKQPDADYLKIQEGAQALYSRYEVSFGSDN
ncbi:MAG: hypothetical protein SGPRY_005794 [Prymnesium sp.]